MATRMFLRDTTANTAGYAATEKSTALPVGTANLAGVAAQDLSTTAGAAATSQTLASLAQTTHQDGYFKKWISAALTGVSSITAQTWTLAVMVSQANVSANSFVIGSVYVLASDDTVRGFVYDSDTPLGSEWANSAEGRVVTFSGGAVSGVVSTDRLVLEFWQHGVQGMAASYSQVIRYNGANTFIDLGIEADPASYLETPQDGLFDVGGGAQNLAGVLFTAAPTFPAGAITSLYNLAGTLFTEAPTFNTGTITASYDLAGVLYQNTPTFPQGAVTPGVVDLAGVLFVKAPTFPQGAIETAGGTQNLSGVLFTKAPTFPQGAVTASYDLTGTLFQKAPTFFTGATTSTVDLAGTLFAKAPTFPPGIVTQEGGPQPLGGVLFQKAPTFPQGAVTAGTVNLDGALFQKVPTFPIGGVAATYDLAGTLFQNTPVFPQGAVTADQTLTGILYQNTPTFPTGTIGVAGELTGVLYQLAPTFFTGAMSQAGGSFWRPDPAAYTVNPAAYTPVGPSDVPPWPIEVHGNLFESDPLFPVGAVS